MEKNDGLFLKFFEIVALCLVPIGMLQLIESMTRWEYQLVSRWSVVLPVLGGIILVSVLAAYLWELKGGGNKWHSVIQTIIVLYLAYSISKYGAAKIMGTQFQPPNYILDTPVGELNGFWLTWTYYGFSHTMALILGWTQVTGCLLILFRATRLVGVLVLLPVMLNIDLIDHFFKISPLAYYNALQYTFLLLVLLVIDFPILKAAVLAYRDKARIRPGWPLLNVLRVGVVVLAFVNIELIKAKFPARSLLNGSWVVDSVVQHHQTLLPVVNGGVAWSKLYFEWRYGCLFKYDLRQAQKKDLNGHYSVDEKTQMVSIGLEGGKGKETDSMNLHYLFLKDSSMLLRGTFRHDSLLVYAHRQPRL